MNKFDKPYNFQEVEEKIYKLWEESGFFNPDKLPGEKSKTFSMIMPPPNSNGSLHLGHKINYIF
ncbi:class I tRNA ligase family protein [Candidatus Wolfebacteria bacterium]|nr:class I tRNA ligase family protein [Candidatus Wolfebacteria bacterium]